MEVLVGSMPTSIIGLVGPIYTCTCVGHFQKCAHLGLDFLKKVNICVSSYIAFITSEVYIGTQKKPYARLISLLKVKFYQKLGLFQRNVNVVTTKTNFHLNGFVILSRNLNKYFSHDQVDLIQYFRP